MLEAGGEYAYMTESALMGWYMLVPSIENQKVILDRPPSTWRHTASAFDTAGDCDIYRQASINSCDTGKYDQEIL